MNHKFETKNRVLIINILIIAAILAVTFLSQAFTGDNAVASLKNSNPIKKGSGYASLADAYLNNIDNSVGENAYSTLSEFQNKAEAVGENIKKSAAGQVNNLKENSISSPKKFIAEKVLQALGVSPQDIIGTENLQCPQ